ESNDDASGEIYDEGSVGKLDSHAARDICADPVSCDRSERAAGGDEQIFLQVFLLPKSRRWKCTSDSQAQRETWSTRSFTSSMQGSRRDMTPGQDTCQESSSVRPNGGTAVIG